MSTITIPGVGPVKSVYVYAGGAVVVGVVAWSYWRRPSGGDGGQVVEEVPEDGTNGDVADGWGNVPGQTGNSNGGWVPDGDRDPATVAEWTQLAIERMSDIGYDPQAVAQAIGLWLAGQTVTATQADMLRVVKAIMPAVPGMPEPPIRIGLPPNPPPTPPKPTPKPGTRPPAPKPPAPKPTPKPAPKPVPKYVTVARFTSKNPPWNSTLSGIAAHEHTTVAALLRLNPSIKDPDLIHPGQRIRVK